MQTTLALVAALASAAYAAPAPQGVTEPLTPPGGSPPGAQSSYSGAFEITAINTTTSEKRDLTKRACDAPGSLTLTLQDGILKDSQNRIGYVAANQQFQFDGPPQTGAIYTAGWSVLSNFSLALGPTTVFYQCQSGNPEGGDAGAFYNLYFDKAFDICFPATLAILPCAGGSAPGGGPVGEGGDGQPSGPPASQIGDGQPQQPTGNPVTQIPDGQVQQPTGAPITQISDGQVQAPTGAPITQISDGQVQAPTGAPITQIPDGQVQAPTGAPITQIPDGQVQAPTGAPVTQISDGQVQAPTGAPITQIPDGQVQAPTGAPVTQISDGQVQAPTGAPITQIPDGQVQAPTGAPVTQISDGQVQAPTGAPITQIPDGQVQAPTGAPVTQIPDGQVQAPTPTTPVAEVSAPSASAVNTDAPIPFTGSASSIKAGLFSVLGAVVAVALL